MAAIPLIQMLSAPSVKETCALLLRAQEEDRPTAQIFMREIFIRLPQLPDWKTQRELLTRTFRQVYPKDIIFHLTVDHVTSVLRQGGSVGYTDQEEWGIKQPQKAKKEPPPSPEEKARCEISVYMEKNVRDRTEALSELTCEQVDEVRELLRDEALFITKLEEVRLLIGGLETSPPEETEACSILGVSRSFQGARRDLIASHLSHLASLGHILASPSFPQIIPLGYFLSQFIHSSSETDVTRPYPRELIPFIQSPSYLLKQKKFYDKLKPQFPFPEPKSTSPEALIAHFERYGAPSASPIKRFTSAVILRHHADGLPWAHATSLWQAAKERAEHYTIYLLPITHKETSRGLAYGVHKGVCFYCELLAIDPSVLATFDDIPGLEEAFQHKDDATILQCILGYTHELLLAQNYDKGGEWEKAAQISSLSGYSLWGGESEGETIYYGVANDGFCFYRSPSLSEEAVAEAFERLSQQPLFYFNSAS